MGEQPAAANTRKPLPPRLLILISFPGDENLLCIVRRRIPIPISREMGMGGQIDPMISASIFFHPPLATVKAII